MHLALVDWIIIVGYCVFSLVVGLYYSKRASQDIGEFFVGGKEMSWWLAGTSMVATTFAADTPLVVSGLVRKGGIYENWLWWSTVTGGMVMVFFYAKLWRRAELITDNEFNELRYDGKAASALRGANAAYGAFITNCIVLGWVLLAMVKICAALFDLSALDAAGVSVTGIHFEWGKLIIISALVIMTLGYTALSGYWGVVMTDFVQFIFAMAGAIALAVIVVWKLGGPAEMVHKVIAAPGVDPKVIHFVPDLRTAGKLALITFAVQIGLQGWLGGAGGGYIAQRLFSTRNEKHAVLSALWFNFAQFVLRSWPWVIVGLASLAYFPLVEGEDHELMYPKMIVEFLPTGLRGLMVASLLAAFMSTVSTQLNWGASYLVSDLYQRFIVRNASERHYVNAARWATLLIVAGGAFAAWQADNISHVWIYLMTLSAGGGILSLIRWYWWRVNAWSEITALGSSLIVANLNLIARPFAAAGTISAPFMSRIEWFYSSDIYPIRLVFILVVCTSIWLAVTYLTPPVADERLDSFYRRVRPKGWWGPVALRCPEVVPDNFSGGWMGCLAGTVCIYSSLFGIGYLCLAQLLWGCLFMVIAGLSGWLTLAQVSSDRSSSL
ncbi:MAG: Na+:solute symporter [Candidatus Hydrogenedentes bacterium]|nr:Na+:solute symporter [Candidatus Hydrogenedentota bacterium]